MVKLGMKFVVISCILVAAALTSLLLVAKAGYKLISVCRAGGCKDIGEQMVQGMNLNANPCKDMYDYACGRWYKLLKPLNHSVFDEMSESLRSNVKDLLQGNHERSPFPVRLSADFYRNCVDTAIYWLSGWLKDEMSSGLGEWPPVTGSWADVHESQFNLTDKFGLIRATYNSSWILGVNIGQHPKYKVEHIIVIGQPEVDELWRSLVSKNGGNISPLVAEDYAKTIDEWVPKLSSDDFRDENLTKEVANFKESIERLIIETKDSKPKLTTLISIEETTDKIGIRRILESIFNAANIKIGKSEPILLENEDYFMKVSELVAATPKRVLASYIGLRFIQKFGAIISRIPPETKARETHCFDETIKYYEHAMKRMYIEKYFDIGHVTRVRSIIDALKETIINDKTIFQYAEGEARIRLIKKLKKIDFVIGRQEWISNRTKLEEFYTDFVEDFKDKNFLQVMIETLSGYSVKNLKKLRAISRKSDFLDDPHVLSINYSYIPEENSISLSAGLLQQPVLFLEAPHPIMYGSVGSLIAETMVHAFDDIGKDYDENGVERKWIDRKAVKKIEDSVQCYSDNFDPIIGIGALHQNKLIATIEGVNIAMKTLERIISNVREIRVPKQFKDLSAQQLFYVSYSQLFCISDKSNDRPLNMILHNSEHFRKTFECRKPRDRLLPNCQL